ncbi:MAG: dockerin type I repeat-containing protein, partial [Oscillospiraceae bacterium]|nr:dockerin type I repeat-containing protein [Oscillospiraceae bacterium]
MLFAGTDADKGMNGVPAAADGSALAQMYYDVADEASVIAAAQSLGLTLKSDAEHGSYYSFPLSFDKGLNSTGEKPGPACEAVLTSEDRAEINFEAGAVNIMVTSAGTTTSTVDVGTTTTTTTTTTTVSSDNGSSTTTTTTTNTGDPNWNDLIGDTNLDGRVGVQDIICLNKYLLGQVQLSEQALRNAACKNDGVINGDDLISLMNFLVDLIPSLPEA